MTGLRMMVLMSSRVELVEEYLDFLIPEPWCELRFTKDYELLIAIVLSAQTTDKRVNEVTSVLFSKYPSLKELKDASLSSLEEILKPLGSFRKKSSYVHEIATLLDEKYDGKVPIERETLESFPGVGRKTVNVFLCEFYEIPELAVDTHVERVSKRLSLAKKEDSVYTVEMKLKRKFKKEDWCKRHKQMVLFGRYYCKAMKPECSNCQLRSLCREKKS